MNVLARLATPPVRLAHPRGRDRSVVRGPLRGTKFVVRDATGVSYALGRDNHNLAFLAAKTPAGGAVYDVGGNRGQVCLLFSRAAGPSGRGVTFEPMAGPADDLEHNLALNGCGNVRLIRAAASDAEGTATFDSPERRNAGTRGASSGPSSRPTDTTPPPCRRSRRSRSTGRRGTGSGRRTC